MFAKLAATPNNISRRIDYYDNRGDPDALCYYRVVILALLFLHRIF